MKSYKDLIVWQKSIQLVEQIFIITQNFPKTEQYGLTSQMRRAAVAIPSNIAEGTGRHHRKEFAQFVYISRGSAKELETQLIIASRLGYMSEREFRGSYDLLEEIMKMLNSLCNKLSTKN